MYVVLMLDMLSEIDFCSAFLTKVAWLSFAHSLPPYFNLEI